MTVIDASVAIKCVFDEEGSDEARRILIEETLCAPAFIDIEAANSVRNRVARRELDGNEALRLFSGFRNLPIRRTSDSDVLASALRLGVEMSHPVYDCLYLALALETGAQLLTADRKFSRALLTGGYSAHLRFVGPDHP